MSDPLLEVKFKRGKNDAVRPIKGSVSGDGTATYHPDRWRVIDDPRVLELVYFTHDDVANDEQPLDTEEVDRRHRILIPLENVVWFTETL